MVLDELNKYAPREGSRPIKEVLLDIAERGRSLGRDPDRRPADRQRGGAPDRRQLGDQGGRPARPGRGRPPGIRLPAGRPAASGRCWPSPGTMFVNQPEHPGAAGGGVPVPGLGDPAGRGGGRARATLRSLVRPDPFAVVGRLPRRGTRRRRHPVLARPPMRILHTSDWHVGKVLKGHVAAATSSSPCWPRSSRSPRPSGRPGHRRRGPLRHRRAERRGPGWSPGRCPRCAAPARRWSPSPATTTTAPALDALRPLGRGGRDHPARAVRAGRRTHVITGDTAGGEAWRLVALPFLSQRYAVRAAEMFELTAGRGQPDLRRPMARADRRADRRTYRPDAVNLVTAHLTVVGGTLGGGERDAHTDLGVRRAGDGVPGRHALRGARATCTGRSRCPARARCATAAARSRWTSARRTTRRR